MQLAAAEWQGIRASERMEDAVKEAKPATLIRVREYLNTQDLHGVLWFGLGLIENEMIARYVERERMA